MNHQEQKDRARQEALHHANNSTVDGGATKEEYKKDVFYHQDREEYLAKNAESQRNGGRNPPSVPKSMLEEEYDKSPGGGYTHNGKKHGPRHERYNK